MLEKILEGPLECKEIKSLNPKGNQPRIFVGRTDAETEYSLEGLMLKLKLQYFVKSLIKGILKIHEKPCWKWKET